MKNRLYGLLLPATLLLSACTTVEPVIKDNGPRTAACIDGGPDSVAQQFYDLRLQTLNQGIPNSQTLARYWPYLSDKLYQQLSQVAAQNPALRGDLFSSAAQGPTEASVADASTIPNRDARNIPLRVDLSRQNQHWQDEVAMIHEGNCWVVNDVRYLGAGPHLGGSLSQLLENQTKKQ